MPSFERQGRVSEPMTTIYPAVVGGQCEFHGVMDPLQPSHLQYTLCDHFKGMGQVQCSYCPDTVNPVDVINQRRIIIHGSPSDPSEAIAVCDSYNCSQAHLKRFKRNLA